MVRCFSSNPYESDIFVAKLHIILVKNKFFNFYSPMLKKLFKNTGGIKMHTIMLYEFLKGCSFQNGVPWEVYSTVLVPVSGSLRHDICKLDCQNLFFKTHSSSEPFCMLTQQFTTTYTIFRRNCIASAFSPVTFENKIEIKLSLEKI